MKQTLTEGKVSAQLIKLTIPLIWGVFSVIAFSVIDTYYVGRLGTESLAAMSFTFPVVMTFGSLAMGLGIGASSVIARAIGEGDSRSIRRLTTDSLTLSFLVVIILALIGLLTIDPLFTAPKNPDKSRHIERAVLSTIHAEESRLRLEVR